MKQTKRRVGEALELLRDIAVSNVQVYCYSRNYKRYKQIIQQFIDCNTVNCITNCNYFVVIHAIVHHI